jgi:hypothetical protein
MDDPFRNAADALYLIGGLEPLTKPRIDRINRMDRIKIGRSKLA